MNLHGLLADLILFTHFGVVVFVVGGQALILLGGHRHWRWIRNRGFRACHLLTIVLVVIQAWLGRLCPLTIWEHDLRRLAGQPIHERTFVEYWVGQVIFLDLPWWIFVAAYTLFAVLVVWSWGRYPPRGPRRNRPDGM